MVKESDPAFSERVAQWRERMGITQEQARKVLGVGRSYYSKLESGKKKPGKFLVEKFDIIEQEPKAFILDELAERSSRIREEAKANHGIRAKPTLYSEESRLMKVRRVPILGWAQAGSAVDFATVREWDDYLSIEINDPKAIAIRVRGDSMAPEIPEGSIVVLMPSDRPEDEDLVCARLKDEGLLLKRLKIVDPQKRLFRLISSNPNYKPIERTEDQFVWIFPVHGFYQQKKRR